MNAEAQTERELARAADINGYAVLAISAMFLIAVGWWGAEQQWWEAFWAAAAAIVLAWCAGGELGEAREHRRAAEWIEAGS